MHYSSSPWCSAYVAAHVFLQSVFVFLVNIKGKLLGFWLLALCATSKQVLTESCESKECKGEAQSLQWF